MEQSFKSFRIEDEKIKVDIANYGATIMAIYVKDKFGNETNVVLGYDTIEDYTKNGGYFGATVGRYGNRIGNASFEINGETFHVGNNEGKNALHGGFSGFDKKVWNVDYLDKKSIVFSYLSVDMEEGFPGNLKTTVKYSLENGAIKIEYFAESDKDTAVNLTNHAYFNLNGEGNGDVLDTTLYINADKVTKVGNGLIPTGELMNVENTPFDFRKEKKIGKDILDSHEQLKVCGGYDINYALNGEGLRLVAKAKGDISGITMNVYTDDIGIQFYSGNFLNGSQKRKSHAYLKHYGFCLETQHFPNSVNIKEFPTTILKKGKKYNKTTIYSFSI